MASSTRRKFLETVGKTAGLLLTGVALLPALAAWWRRPESAAGEDSETWVDLGRAAKIPEGEWLARRFSFERRNRWRRELVEEIVYVHREGRDLEVISAICPHARCLVGPHEAGGFVCPCHESSFDGMGNPLDGPSPRSLDTLEWRVEEGRLKVHIQQFRSGIVDKEVVGV